MCVRVCERERETMHVKKVQIEGFSADVKNLIEFRPH